jgi:thiol-disulfide isomerase/thioredoxin
MTTIPILPRRFLFRAIPFAVVAALTTFCGLPQAGAATATPATSPDADSAWKAVEKAMVAPAPPGEWQIQQPTQDQVDKFRAEQARLAGVAADKVKDFFTRFPNDARAAEARQTHLQLLQISARAGNTNRLAELQTLQEQRAKDPGTSEDEQVALRVQMIQRAANEKEDQGMAAVLAEYEKGARELRKQFPKRDEPFQLLLLVAENSDAAKTRALVEEVAAGAQTAQMKEEAQGLLKQLELVGKPLELRFTAVDGRAVDVSKLAGKVVLLDFWATWCGPCVAEVPNVVKAYERLHPKGFEIVGISFDRASDKAKLEKFVADHKMPWPQFFDGQYWENKYGRQFGIHSIPSMWLVDKKGNLRDLNGRDGLAGKVEKLLAE